MKAVRPILYLDVDGVLWDFRHPEAGSAAAAEGIAEFMDFVLSRFEVRWLTYWAPTGSMDDAGIQRLEEHTGLSRAIWTQVRASRGFTGTKARGISWAEYRAGRPFVWVDDDVGAADLDYLRRQDCLGNLFLTDVLKDADALLKTLARLRSWIKSECSSAGQS